MLRGVYISSGAGNTSGTIPAPAQLWSVNVTKPGSAGDLISFFDAPNSTDSLKVIATIDVSQVGSYWFGIYCASGLTWALSSSSADITLGYR